MEPTLNDRRRFQRIKFDAGILLEQGQHCWATELVDVSLRGLLAKRPSRWNGDTEQLFQACIGLDEHRRIEMQLQLAWSDDERLGFICRNIDLYSISHLRHLMAQSLGDELLLKRDLSMMLSG